MSEERLSRLESIVEANTAANRQLGESIDALVSEFIRPVTQQAFANYERLERVEAALAALVNQSSLHAERLEETHRLCEVNQQQIASSAENITRLESSIAGGFEATQRQIDSSAENITRLEALAESNSEVNRQQTDKIARLENGFISLNNRISEQSQQIQVLIEEGRADRQIQRETIAAILSVSNRVDVLERRSS
ncbi:MAG: hypothetical protein AAF716_05025 [Cyanobacteria bacterium P01_D01_bin.1]